MRGVCGRCYSRRAEPRSRARFRRVETAYRTRTSARCHRPPNCSIAGCLKEPASAVRRTQSNSATTSPPSPAKECILSRRGAGDRRTANGSSRHTSRRRLIPRAAGGTARIQVRRRFEHLPAQTGGVSHVLDASWTVKQQDVLREHPHQQLGRLPVHTTYVAEVENDRVPSLGRKILKEVFPASHVEVRDLTGELQNSDARGLKNSADSVHGSF